MVAKDAGWVVDDPIAELPFDSRFPEGVTCLAATARERPGNEFSESMHAADVFCQYLKGEKWTAESMDLIPEADFSKAVEVAVSAKPSSIFMSSTVERAFNPIPLVDLHFGPEPQEFRSKNNEEIGGDLIRAAGEIEFDARDVVRQIISSRDRKREFLSNYADRFRKCCLQRIRELRVEGYRRIGTATMDKDEESGWQAVTEGFEICRLDPNQRCLEPMEVTHYARQLQKLGSQVEQTRAQPANR